MKRIAFICLLALSLQGCLVTAVGAGVGAVMYGSAKKDEANTKCKDSYTQYLQVMQKSKQVPMTLEKYCS